MILLIANWKMSPEKPAEAISLAKKIQINARIYKKEINTVVCVPSIHIPILTKNIKSLVSIGGQGVSHLSDIAQTGLLSAGMLKNYGAKYCIVGHSEARARGESQEQVLGATLSLLQKGLTPIVCIGEKERDSHGWYLSSVKEQIESIVQSVPKEKIKNLVFAYEPIWAIGKNAIREANPAECREMIIFIKKNISDIVGEKIANKITILYGGSVNEKNAGHFISEGGAGGLLIGRASLEPKKFSSISKLIVSSL